MPEAHDSSLDWISMQNSESLAFVELGVVVVDCEVFVVVLDVVSLSESE